MPAFLSAALDPHQRHACWSCTQRRSLRIARSADTSGQVTLRVFVARSGGDVGTQVAIGAGRPRTDHVPTRKASGTR
jgi:hypothetical protein